MSESPQIPDSDVALAAAETKFAQAQQLQKKLKQRRSDGKLLYEGWQGSQDWHNWRMQQLERQNWKCACCSIQMGFGEKTYLANGDFMLEPQHPTVEHILPKSLFPKLTLDKQNLVITCWACNKKKSNDMVSASRLRHELLKQKLNPHQQIETE
ncbi:HNH endonuclease [Trichocoleus sp. FACHB-591]|uniref:HNH endonuclease n=1 Tax=Trichocoleus sp. FACHB-591 TaxID=2692872 RepID=UPI001688BD33|nr:HNH endonuclease [Trichocoleus sp. FACHB-591]MBD2095118.1 HNH endonuclease [Trichocoleus sp. FACHB-591]